MFQLFGRRVPAWPPLAGVAALLGAIVISTVVPLIVMIPAAIAGVDRADAGFALLAALLVSGALLVLVARVAALTRPVSAEQLGLRRPDRPVRAVLLALGLAAALAAIALAWQALGDVAGSLTVPPELDPRSAFAQAYDLPVRDPMPVLPLVLSALARCVLPVVAVEVLLRGFAFPALCAWKGPVPAALIVGVLFGGLSELSGAPGVAVLSMLLGVALCFLYVATGSLLPGVGVSAAAAAVALGVACSMAPLAVIALAAGSTAAATLLAAAPVLQRRPAAAPVAV
jgi:membrane protease YdiL (CAAX protease family)